MYYTKKNSLVGSENYITLLVMLHFKSGNDNTFVKSQ